MAEEWLENPNAAKEEQEAQEEHQHEELEEQQEQEEEEHQEDDEPRSVNSTMVSEWGYNREAEEIEVTFNNGRTESYSCSAQQWEQAKEAVSAGKFIHENFL